MCGIAGLLLTDPDLQPSLGRLMVPMMERLEARGPDSTGVALYSDGIAGTRFSIRRQSNTDGWDEIARRLAVAAALELSALSTSTTGDLATLTVAGPPEQALAAIRSQAAHLELLGYGEHVEVIKDVGGATAVSDRYSIQTRAGYQGVGHTRMATESAITTLHSHPFCPASDLCLVHNGSFSNHASVRRELQDAGVEFDTDNDSEVAARFIGQRLAEGDTLAESLRHLRKQFDGFYTLVVTTPTEFCVVRDAFACKPMTIAETDSFVAVASEYRALTELPGIESARVFEPEPEEIYTWSR